MLNFDPHRWIAEREQVESGRNVATVATVARLHAESEKSFSQESPATLATTATKSACNPSATLREWHSHLAPLPFDTAPDGFTLQRWRHLHGDSWWLYENFAAQAVRDGWSAHDLFGVFVPHPGWGGLCDRLQGARNLKMAGPKAVWSRWGGAGLDLHRCRRCAHIVRAGADLGVEKLRKAKTKPETPVPGTKNEATAGYTARLLAKPFLRHGVIASDVANKMMSKSPDNPAYSDYAKAIRAEAEQARDGDMAMASEMLTAQAISLDAIFTEMVRRSVLNMGEYFDASERYMRLALKAQTNSRAALEALAKLHQPREQTVRHVHVNEGGQAVIADQFHHHVGGNKNAKPAEQPHAPGNGAAGNGPAMLGHDPQAHGVPISSREGEPAVPNARRQGKRRVSG